MDGSARAHGAENMLKGLPHPYSKQCCFDVDSGERLSVYFRDSRESADALLSDQILKSFQQSMGTIPSIKYYDTIVTVDICASGAICR